MDAQHVDLDNRSHGTNRDIRNRWRPMIAGSICEATDCTGLVLMLLAALAALVLATIVIVLAWAATVAAVLERRGWGSAKRRTASATVAVGGVVVLWEGGSVSVRSRHCRRRTLRGSWPFRSRSGSVR